MGIALDNGGIALSSGEIKTCCCGIEYKGCDQCPDGSPNCWEIVIAGVTDGTGSCGVGCASNLNGTYILTRFQYINHLSGCAWYVGIADADDEPTGCADVTIKSWCPNNFGCDRYFLSGISISPNGGGPTANPDKLTIGIGTIFPSTSYQVNYEIMPGTAPMDCLGPNIYEFVSTSVPTGLCQTFPTSITAVAVECP